MARKHGSLSGTVRRDRNNLQEVGVFVEHVVLLKQLPHNRACAHTDRRAYAQHTGTGQYTSLRSVQSWHASNSAASICVLLDTEEERREDGRGEPPSIRQSLQKCVCKYRARARTPPSSPVCARESWRQRMRACAGHRARGGEETLSVLLETLAVAFCAGNTGVMMGITCRRSVDSVRPVHQTGSARSQEFTLMGVRPTGCGHFHCA